MYMICSTMPVRTPYVYSFYFVCIKCMQKDTLLDMCVILNVLTHTLLGSTSVYMYIYCVEPH